MTGTAVKRGRGRPRQAAQSLDEALAMVYDGRKLPARPRNKFERQAFAKKRGRPKQGETPVKIAAQLARVLMENASAEGVVISQRGAAKSAADQCKVEAESVRKALQRLMLSGKVVVQRHEKTWAGVITQSKELPFVVDPGSVARD